MVATFGHRGVGDTWAGKDTKNAADLTRDPSAPGRGVCGQAERTARRPTTCGAGVAAERARDGPDDAELRGGPERERVEEPASLSTGDIVNADQLRRRTILVSLHARRRRS